MLEMQADHETGPRCRRWQWAVLLVLPVWSPDGRFLAIHTEVGAFVSEPVSGRTYFLRLPVGTSVRASVP